ncbi:MAG: GAF domain-containing protein [Thermomicrobiales bacterium]
MGIPDTPSTATPTAPFDLGGGLAVLADTATAIGHAMREAGSLPIAARASALLDAVLAVLRDRVGFDIVWGTLGAAEGVPRALQCLTGPALATEQGDYARLVEPVLASLNFAPAGGRQPFGERLIAPDLPPADGPAAELAAALGLRALLVAPLISRELSGTVGALIAGSRDGALGAGAILGLMEAIGGHLGVAISYGEAVERLRASEERGRILTEGATDGIYMLNAAGLFTYLNPPVERMLGYTQEELVGQHFSVVIAPRALPLATEVMRRAAAGEPLPDRYELDLCRKDGAIRTFEISSSNRYDERTGQFTGRFGIARDITERRRLENELARRNRAVEVLNAIATLSGRTPNLAAFLNEALDRTLAVFDVDCGAISLLNENGQEFVLAAARNYSPALVTQIERLPTRAGIPARVLATAGTIVGRDMATDAALLADAIRAEGIGAYACVALRVQDRPLGLLAVTARDDRVFSQADADTLALVGAQLGAAIENARLSAESLTQRASLEVKTAQLSRLLDVSAGFAANLPLETMLNTVARAIVATLGFGSAHVRVRDDQQGDTLAGVGFCGFTADQIALLYAPTPIAFYQRLLAPQYQLGGLYYIPHDVNRRESFGDDWTVVRQPVAPNWQPGQWHPEDALIAPLYARDGGLLGVIYVDEPAEGRLPDADKLTVLELFARQAALAIENADLYGQIQRDLRRQNALREVIEHISAELDRDRLLELILASAVELLDGNAGALCLVEPQRNIARIVATHNVPGELRDQLVQPGKGMTGRVLATGQAQLVRDYNAVLGPPPFGLDLQSCISVPIQDRGEVVGVFFVGSNTTARHYGPRDVATLELFAKHAALALANARLYEEARAQTARLETLREAIEQISSELDLSALLNRLAISAVRLLDADSGTIALVDEETGTARIEAGYNFAPGALGHRFAAGEGLTGLALARRSPVLIDPEDPQPTVTAIPRPPARAHLAVPIWWQNRLIGTFTLSSGRAGKRFTPGDLETLATLARHAAVAIENAGLYSALQERFSQVQGISAVGTALIAERDLDRVLGTVADQVMSLLSAEGCSIALLEPDEAARIPGQELTLAVVSGIGETLLRGRRLSLANSFTGEAILSGQPVSITSLHDDPHRRAPALAAAGIDVILAVPLQTSERAIGALNVYAHRGRVFGVRDSEIITLFAHQAAVAIENARLHEQGRALAVTEERNRMAREIHDTLAQGFTGIIVQLGVAESLLAEGQEDARARLLTAQNLARTSLQEARRSVWNLRPNSLQGRTLPDAIHAHLTQWQAQTGIAATFTVEGAARPLAAETEETVLRVAQEALNNIAKHAHASMVTATLTIAAETVRLRVRDDGVGVVAATARPDGGGFGLISMRERASRLGGTLELESAPGQGTCVQVEVRG